MTKENIIELLTNTIKLEYSTLRKPIESIQNEYNDLDEHLENLLKEIKNNLDTDNWEIMKELYNCHMLQIEAKSRYCYIMGFLEMPQIKHYLLNDFINELYTDPIDFIFAILNEH